MEYHIIFFPDTFVGEAYSCNLERIGIEVISIKKETSINTKKTALEEKLKELGNTIHIGWICRPDLFSQYADLLKSVGALLIYDTVDLHFVRLAGKARICRNEKEKELIENSSQEYKILEIENAKKANLTITITNKEKQILGNQGIDNVAVIPNIHSIKITFNPFEKREGLLFIGNYWHTPNVDAVKWLIQEIMPIVWKKAPNIHVTLLGADPKDGVKELENERVTVPGFIHDVSAFFNDHKVFVCPLRYGAGMKGKIGQSLEYGLPIVTTPIGTEGMDLKENENVLSAETHEEFAEKILLLYNDKELWQTLHNNSARAIQQYLPSAVAENIKVVIKKVMTGNSEI